MRNPKVASPLQLVALLLFILAIFPNPILSRKDPQPFKFLQHLEGCHKGQTVKGLHEVKQYLKKFGYATLDVNNNEDVNDDEFDDILESQIKTYQLNYHLKVTGNLDAQTVKQMMIPRCGVPDNENRGKNKNHGQSSSNLHTVSHYKFFPGTPAPAWPSSKTHLTYRFSSSVPVNVNIETLRSVSSQAFASWAAVTRFTFSEAAASDQQADIVIGFHRGDHNDGYSFDGPGRTFAHAFSPPDGRFHYDADENWSTNPGPDMVDLESVAVHEIGHLLGLDHSLEPDAIMYAYINRGVRKRELRADDIQGIRALYG